MHAMSEVECCQEGLLLQMRYTAQVLLCSGTPFHCGVVFGSAGNGGLLFGTGLASGGGPWLEQAYVGGRPANFARRGPSFVLSSAIGPICRDG